MNKNRKQRLSYIFINPNDNKVLEALLCDSIICRLAEAGSISPTANDL